MKKCSIVFVGVGGYASLYPELYRRSPHVYDPIAQPVGIVDPYVKSAPCYAWAVENNIPIYNTIEDFYSEYTADLAVIATPIALHKHQCLTALAHGSHVLCEKPLAPLAADVLQLQAAAQKAGRYLGVGFQWSFCRPIAALKADILSGALGAPRHLKALLCWKRGHDYYNTGGWKGRLCAADGSYILDSVVTNATAHYLHNIFFVMGGAPDTAAMPTGVSAEVYRSKDIESFDTVVLKGSFAGGATFWYGATHSNDGDEVCRFCYDFEKAQVRFNVDAQDNRIYAHFADGTVRDYGNPQAAEEQDPKFLTMIRAALGQTDTVPCTPATVLPHAAVCNALFDTVGIADIAPQYRLQGDPAGTWVQGMSAALESAWAANTHLQAPWAVPPVAFAPGAKEFDGVKER